jgi:hypothetical protein
MISVFPLKKGKKDKWEIENNLIRSTKWGEKDKLFFSWRGTPQ